MTPRGTGRVRGSPDAATVVGPGVEKTQVPPRALLISVSALMVPLAATTLTPELLADEYELLIWLPALIPAFLLTYYHGWGGASFALAGGMGTIVLSQVVLSLTAAQPPQWPVLLVLVLILLFVSVAVGWFGELLLRARRRAEAVALRDPLTGLPNRGHLRLFLDTAFGAAERGGNLTVIMFDLDRFKRINDDYGHAAGDETLVAFAELLRKHTRRSDLSARFGGEEFVAILTGPGGSSGAKIFTERVRDALKAIPFEWGPVTTSAGIADYNPGLTSPDIVLAEADRALYKAKEDGRDRVVLAQTLPEEIFEGGDGEEADAAPVETSSSADEPTTPKDVRGGGTDGREPRILIVDDDESMTEGVSRILRRAGFRTGMAHDGVEALADAAKEQPALVLSDVAMPRMGGLTLAERVRDVHPGVLVVLMSGYEHDRVMNDVPSPVVGFVQKPMTPVQLVEAVRAALAGDPLPLTSSPASDS